MKPIRVENAEECNENLTIYTKTPNRVHTRHGNEKKKQKTRRRTRNTQHTPEISERAGIDSTPTKPMVLYSKRPEKQRRKNTAQRRNDATQYPVSVGCLVKTNNLENSNFVFGNTFSFVLCCESLFRRVEQRRARGARTNTMLQVSRIDCVDGGEGAVRDV